MKVLVGVGVFVEVLVGVGVGVATATIRRTWSTLSTTLSGPAVSLETPRKRICSAFASAGVLMTVCRPEKLIVESELGGGLAVE